MFTMLLGIRWVFGSSSPSPPVPMMISRIPRAESPAPSGVCGRRAEVAEIPRGGGARVVLVVAGDRTRAGQVPSPAGPVAVLVLCGRATRHGVVAQREDRARNGVEQRGGRLVVAAVAARDVPGAHERHRARGRRGALRRRPERGGGGTMVVFDAGDRDAKNGGPGEAPWHVPQP